MKIMQESFVLEIGNWVQLGIAVGTVVVASIALVWRWGKESQKFQDRVDRIEEKNRESLKGQGERIGKNESHVSKLDTELGELKRVDQQHEFQIMETTNEIGKLSGQLERISQTLERGYEERMSGNTEIKERLARIEERMDIFKEMKDVLIAAVTKL